MDWVTAKDLKKEKWNLIMHKVRKVLILLGVLILLLLIFYYPVLTGEKGKTKIKTNSSTEFVYRCGTEFCLGEEEFKFIGVNIPSITSFSEEEVEEYLKKISSYGIKVIRVYADYGEGIEEMKKNIKKMDYILDVADKYGIKVIVTFTSKNGMIKRYGLRFFSDKNAREEYKEMVGFLINRYKNRSVIFSWELINEPEYLSKHFEGELNFEEVEEWIEEMSSYVKALDKKHMVSIGTGGVWQYYASAENYEKNYFVEMHSIKNIDFSTIHFYGFSSLEWNKKRIRELFRKMIEDSHMIGKPVILEEFGFKRSWGEEKVEWYKFILDVFFEEGGQGAMYWQSRPGTKFEEEFGISENPEDQEIYQILLEKYGEINSY